MKSYLGDAVYCEFDGFALILTAENGISVTNRIVLEPEVYSALVAFVARLKGPDDLFERSFSRPHDFFDLPFERQWEIDRELGLLDWEPSKLTPEQRARFDAHYERKKAPPEPR